ncbi:SAM-dependent methyltransferase [Micromonospora sp. NPDC050397]|uniref:SAM-dependent methyltransferase n=1 Tax=Micromonospora sp. NPDC050397 TaxID=3364279 RepID=UPI00384F071D
MSADQEVAATVPQIYRDVTDADGRHGDAANRIVATNARVPLVAQANRAWLGRVVDYLAREGVRQFLDIGSGMVDVGSTHEIARAVRPDARVVYVDIDPETVRQAADALRDDARAIVVEADLTQAGELLRRLDAPDVRKVLTFDEPVAVLLAAVLHFVPDGQLAGDAVATVRDQLAPGSYLAISHGATEAFTAEEVAKLQAAYQQTTAARPTPRDRGQVAEFFGDLELVDPGLMWISQWRPRAGSQEPAFEEPRRSGLHAGVGHLR